jgi:hypothetical protein
MLHFILDSGESEITNYQETKEVAIAYNFKDSGEGSEASLGSESIESEFQKLDEK